MVLALGTVLGMVLLAPWANAQSQRAGRSQFSFPIVFTSGVSYDSDLSSVDINDDVGWGIGFGWHVSEKVMVGGDFTWLDANYDVFVATDFDGDQIADDSIEVSGTLDATNFQMYAQYNIIDGRFTPFVRGSFGWTWIDSNIPSGPATGTCWWDPWWGYICTTYQNTRDTDEFAYQAGVGVRWDVTSGLTLKLGYDKEWIDLGNADSAPGFDVLRLGVAYRY
jgi:opacity protein-like surface antigen